MDRISALQFFVRVVDSGSFSQAARELGVGQPAVSKQIAALERRLGVQLLNRTSRGLRPTPSGTDLYQSAVTLLADLDDAESRIAGQHGSPRGSVRLAAPPSLTDMMIVPKLPGFFSDYPDVSIELVVSERHADLVQDGLDLAIRVGNLDDSGLVARRIGSMQIATVASSAYLARLGAPATPDDLEQHQHVAHRFRGAPADWMFSGPGGPVVKPALARFSCNQSADLHAAVLGGLGIAQSARALFEADLEAGRVVELLAGFRPDPAPIHLVYASQRMPHRVRVLSDFIVQCIDQQPNLRIGQTIP